MKTKLVSEIDGHEIKVGDCLMDFRGDWVMVKDWYTKPFPSTGRVVLEYAKSGWTHPYYPGVIDAVIVEVEDERQG